MLVSVRSDVLSRLLNRPKQESGDRALSFARRALCPVRATCDLRNLVGEDTHRTRQLIYQPKKQYFVPILNAFVTIFCIKINQKYIAPPTPD